MNRRYWIFFVLLSLLLLLPILAGCGSGTTTPAPTVGATPTARHTSATVAVTPPTPRPEPTATAKASAKPTAGVQILKATFAHGLTEEMEPQNPGEDFQPDQTVYLSLKIKGRPKKGLVGARFYWHDQLIAKANVDLSDVNSGVLFSIGENTYAGFTLTHKKPFPISNNYHAAVSYDGKPFGDYSFHVVPGSDAIPTKVSKVTLARGADKDYNPVKPTTTFAPNDTVYLVGRGDFGLATWLQADWYVGGKLDKAGTRSLTLQENATDTGFAFSFMPEGGWPVGEHYVVLTVNDVEVGRYTFTVKQASGSAKFEFIFCQRPVAAKSL